MRQRNGIVHGVRSGIRRSVVRGVCCGQFLHGRIARGVWGLCQQLFHMQREQRCLHWLQPGLRRVNVHRVHRGDVFKPRQSRPLRFMRCGMQLRARHVQSVHGHVRRVRGGIRWLDVHRL